MSTDLPINRRTYVTRKTVPKSRRLPKKKIRGNTVKISKGGHKRMKKNGGYRSAFELQVANYLAINNVEFTYEEKRVVFVPKPRTYTPDFYIPETDIYIEVKGHFTKDDRTKMLLVKEQNPELDIRILFVNAKNKIYKGSKTTYGAWADKHKFDWAEGTVPKEWMKK
jgi:hypothetical protein